jgi:hypothetical protein
VTKGFVKAKGFKEKTLREREESRKQTLDKLLNRVKQQQEASKQKRGSPKETPPVLPVEPLASPKPAVPVVMPVTLTPPRLGTSDGAIALNLTPWGRELALSLLECARDKKIMLRLVWPAEIDTAVPLHAIASLGTILDLNLAGIRTLYYPGTDTTWATLDRITTDRGQYDALCKGFFNGVTPKRDVDSVRAALNACHEANYAKRTPLLRIRQLVPAFRYDNATGKWAGVKELPIDALIRRIPKASIREPLRARIDPTWNDPVNAPGALLVLHRNLKGKDIKAALGGGRGSVRMGFDAVLMDASTRAIIADSASVDAIPKRLTTIQEAARGPVGALIVTNDPNTYGSLAKRLENAGFQVDKRVLAAEAVTGTAWLASTQEFNSPWVPEPRGMVNFKVRATDEQATKLARQIRRIADAVRHEESDVEEPFIRAQHLIQRASLIPGGICDALNPDGNTGWSPLTAQLDLAHIIKLIQGVHARGGATTQRKQIEEMINKIRSHLDACAEATPLAEQLKSQIERYAIEEKEGMTIVIFSARDIAIAQQYLNRVLGERWAASRSRVQWLTLTEALTELTARASQQRVVIVGLNPRMLRFLATQKEVPVRTTLLIPLHQAARMLPQLRFLSTVDALKAYRGRLVELKSKLETCLADGPDIDSLVRIYDTRLPSSAHQNPTTSAADPSAHQLDLDDGRSISVSGTIFRYEDRDESGFHRVAVKDIHLGDSVFDMSDELREEVETVLSTQFSGFQFSQFRTPLDGYRAMLNQAVESKFPGVSTTDRIPALQDAIKSLGGSEQRPSEYKLRYWLNARHDTGDKAPHFPREKTEYLSFCKTLSIPEALAEQFWLIIKKVRSDNQDAGKQMASLYTEVLLSPESSKIYRGIKPATIQMLRSKALDCVAQVIRIEPPKLPRRASS